MGYSINFLYKTFQQRDSHFLVFPLCCAGSQGAYTDDDTDIEFVTLHALEYFGLDLNYQQITSSWRKYVHTHVNGGDALWFANKVARENMNRGQLPPQTGSQSSNRC